MITENKKVIVANLDKISDDYVSAILEFLNYLEFKQQQSKPDYSSMLLSENSLAKDWLTKEEEAWAHL